MNQKNPRFSGSINILFTICSIIVLIHPSHASYLSRLTVKVMVRTLESIPLPLLLAIRHDQRRREQSAPALDYGMGIFPYLSRLNS